VPAQRKILTRKELADRVREHQAAGQRVALCHGCFDIVHPGHVRHLQEAARLGDRLVVTITSDAQLNKGEGRPLIPQELRAENLAALDCVDWVAINDEPTAITVLEHVRPDLYIKGKEYEQNHDPRFEAEKAAVEAYGGRVVFSSGEVVFSSTALIHAMTDQADLQHDGIRRLMERHGLDMDSVSALVAGFQGQRVLVIGEPVTETYVICDRPEVAGDEAAMTLRPVERQTFDSGAVLIARHLAALGGCPTLLTALPRTPEAQALRQRLKQERIDTRWIEIESGLINIARYFVNATGVINIDGSAPMTVDNAARKQLCSLATEQAHHADAAIIVDRGHGLLSAATIEQLCESARPHVQWLAGGAQGRRSNLSSLRRADLMCVGEDELRSAMRAFDEGLSAVAWNLLDRTSSHCCLVAMGEDGMTSFSRKAHDESHATRDDNAWQNRLDAVHVPPLREHALDARGREDAMLAAATLGLCSTGHGAETAIVAALAAASATSRFGHHVVTAADLRRAAQSAIGSKHTKQSGSAPLAMTQAM